MRNHTKRNITMAVLTGGLIAVLISAAVAEQYSVKHNVDVCLNQHFTFFIGQRDNCSAGSIKKDETRIWVRGDTIHTQTATSYTQRKIN